MLQLNFKSVIEDSSRNKYFFYYSGSSVCCKEVSKDGVTKDTIIASQVIDNFLAAIDLQDRVYIACQNKEKGIYLFQYTSGEWKLEHILNIQGNGDIKLLSLFGINGALHIVYAKEMTVANFYNIFHLYKPESPESYHLNTSWQKSSICEMYSENLSSSYTAVMSKEGTIHLVYEWFDGSKYLINYCWFVNVNEGWKKKTVTSLSKKDITINVLYEEGLLHLLCYTFEEDASAIFYYSKKEGPGRDFEFSCVEKIKTGTHVSPSFHVEGSIIYVSWILEGNFFQYALNREQKNWSKKLSSTIPSNDYIQLIEYVRNRKGKYLIVKNTYFSIDYKYNINLPYFKDNNNYDTDRNDSSEKYNLRNADGDLIRYIPYMIDEIKTLSQMVEAINIKLDQLQSKKTPGYDFKSFNNVNKSSYEPKPLTKDIPKLKQSNFKDQFLKSNKLLNRPEATALFVGSANVPNPEELVKKEGIDFVTNNISEPEPPKSKPEKKETNIEASTSKLDTDPNVSKDGNLFKKIGDFFK